MCFFGTKHFNRVATFLLSNFVAINFSLDPIVKYVLTIENIHGTILLGGKKWIRKRS